MTDEGRIEPGATAYRGFLFSDMRGFTAFAERHGNAAAAAAVGRFLEIARTAIARHHGAEMKTEGDAIHAVFPSASSAVMCGLEIVDAAAELNAQEPDRPLGLGVGVHAGEAVETAEGYIGRAVNIASRLCAAARPGEVLVSSTVKGITQSSIPVGFIIRGRKRLKGIQDPILVYAVTRDVTAGTERETPRPMVLGGAAIAAVAVVSVLAVVGAQLFGNPGASAVPSLEPSVGLAGRPVEIGKLEIASYRSQQFQPPVTFDIKDLDWAANGDTPELLGLVREAAPNGSVQFMRIGKVITEPCVEGAEGALTNPGPKSLLTQVESLQHLEVSARMPIDVGGFEAEAVDILVEESVLAACGGLTGQDVSLFVVGGDVWGAAPGELFRLVSIDVRGEAVAYVMSTDWTQTNSVQELQDLFVVGERILDSAGF